MGILLVYDVTDDQSFCNIRNWICEVEQHALPNVNMVLIGNMGILLFFASALFSFHFFELVLTACCFF